MAPETRAAAKRRRIAGTPLFPSFPIPEELESEILQFTDLPSRVMLAGCGQAQRRRVYRGFDRGLLWRKLDFRFFSSRSSRTPITDNHLEALLENCDAVSVTKVLNLMGCDSITGRGLEPLRGSAALRVIDLRLSERHVGTRGPPGCLDVDFVLGLLSSMPPIARQQEQPRANDSQPLGLALVKIREQAESSSFYGRFETKIAHWFKTFHRSLGTRAIEQRTRCGHCHEVIADLWSSFDDSDHWNDDHWVVSTVMAIAYCELCERYSCGSHKNGDCPFHYQCRFCMVQFCETESCPGDKMMFNCDNLDCKGNMMHVCEDCHLRQDLGVVCSRFGCRKYFCQECTWLLRQCWVCNEQQFCSNCIEDHESECAEHHYEEAASLGTSAHRSADHGA